MRRSIQKGIWAMVLPMIGMVMSFMACSENDNGVLSPVTPVDTGGGLLYAVGVGQSDNDDVLFTEDDILWFDEATRELKFKDMEEPLYKRLEPFREIQIRLGESELLTVNFVKIWDSQDSDNLVLCYGSAEEEPTDNGNFYLYDCYPLQNQDSEAVKANREKNEAHWNAFIKHLKESGKLR